MCCGSTDYSAVSQGTAIKYVWAIVPLNVLSQTNITNVLNKIAGYIPLCADIPCNFIWAHPYSTTSTAISGLFFAFLPDYIHIPRLPSLFLDSSLHFHLITSTLHNFHRYFWTSLCIFTWLHPHSMTSTDNSGFFFTIISEYIHLNIFHNPF